MVKFKLLVFAALFFVFGQPSFANDRQTILGVWQLVSFEVEYQATGEKEPVRGKSPTGYIIFTAEGRMMVVLTNEGRNAPKSVEDRANLFNSMVAYTGTYRIEGDRWITKVDVSANPALVGTDQARFFRRDGERLQEITQWAVRPEKGMARTVITWERAK